MSSSTRATRSRFSSPAHQGAPAVNSPLEVSRNSGNDASRSFLQRWLEPSVQTKTSFEEAGLMRHGVLEGMAPLGALPKVKKPETGAPGTNGNNSGAQTPTTGGVRKITIKMTNAARGDANGTSSGTESVGDKSVAGRKRAASPGAHSNVSSASSRKPAAAAKGVRKKKGDEDDDDDYNPGGRRKKPARRSQAAGEKAHDAHDGEAEQAAPAGQGNRSALSPGLNHYPTAWALKTLYDEKSEDPEFDSVVTDVLQQTADDSTLDEFSKQIGDKKRDGNRDAADPGFPYFAPPSAATANAGRFQPHKGSKLAQYGDLVGDSEDEEEIEEPEELPAAGHDDTVGGTSEREREREREGEGAKRAAKKAKTSHSSSAVSSDNRNLGQADVAVSGSAPGQHNGVTSTALHRHHQDMGMADSTPSRKRRRRNSGSSDSSLSSAVTLPSPEVRSKVGAASSASAGGAAVSGGGGGGGGGPPASAATAATIATTARGATSGTATGTATGPRTQTQTQTQTQKQNNHHNNHTQPQDSRPGAGPKDDKPPRPASIAAFVSAASSRKPRSTSSRQTSNAPSSEPNSPPTSPTSRLHPSSQGPRQASMPGRLAAASSDLLSHLPKSKAKPARDADAPMQQDAAVPRDGQADDELDAIWNRRRDAQTVTNNYVAAESSVRIPEQPRAATPVAKTRKSRRSLANAPTTTRTTRSASKRPNDQLDRSLTPIPLSLAGDDNSAFGSRAVTPTGQRQAKRPKGLRVKSSPVKKSGGPAGGLPRLASESQPSFRAGTPKDPSTDNDEFCSACGNAGDVLCCDGCPRSFHFECVNLSQEEDLPDEWYCNECIVRRFPSRVPIHKGAFAGALNNLEKCIPRAYSLPKRVQNRFEGVKAGADGDYEEVANKNAKLRKGYDEMPDLLKQRDENQPVLCHSCQRPSDDERSIIPCSLCPFYWHLDCLDPPLAVPPVLKTWRCPTHVDDVLADAPSLAPAHKFRKVKNAQPITPIFTRGNKNNGHIEIDWSDEPEPLKDAGWPDPLSFGRTYKVSANGVILDFIEQLRRQGAGYGERQNEQKWVPYPSPAPQPPTQQQRSETPTGPLLGSTLGRTVDEMQASLNLIGLKQKPSDGIDQLTSALLSHADDNVVRLMARGNADNIALGQLAEGDKTSLRAMLAQMDAMSARIRQVLGDTDSKHVSSMPTPDPTASTPPPSLPPLAEEGLAAARVPAGESSSPIAPKKEEETCSTALAALPEPTPPLTENADGTMDLD